MRKYFGTDGVRGPVGQEPITPQTVMKIGWAAGRVLASDLSRGKVLIGKDTRVSGYMLESALEAGFSAAGVDISLLGPMPTPGIAYLTRTSRASAGVVISASHNPYQDNGIKFFSSEGQKLDDTLESAIEAEMAQPMTVSSADTLGKATRFSDSAGRYIEFCKSAIDHKLSLKGVKIVADCANGAAYHIAPSVFAELGADVTVIACEPDGFNINRSCGSTHTDQLQKKVLDVGADIGIALDGDGDRAVLVDEKGTVANGDQMLFVITEDRIRNRVMRGGVVGTTMSNLGFENAMADRGVAFVRAPVGDRYIMAELLDRGWEVGGEASGHIMCLDKTTTGDGIIAALQVLQALVRTRKPLSELTGGMTIYPQSLLNIPLPPGTSAREFIEAQQGCVEAAVKDVESELGENGRVVLRPSGTEPVVRVMVEGKDRGMVSRLSQQLADVVRSVAA